MGISDQRSAKRVLGKILASLEYSKARVNRYKPISLLIAILLSVSPGPVEVGTILLFQRIQMLLRLILPLLQRTPTSLPRVLLPRGRYPFQTLRPVSR